MPARADAPATARYRRRTPATNSSRNTDPHRMMVVPRSRWRITSSDDHAHDRRERQESAGIVELLPLVARRWRERHDRQLEELGGLQGDGSEVDPARSAVEGCARVEGCSASSISGRITEQERHREFAARRCAACAQRHHQATHAGHGVDQLAVEVPEAGAVALGRRDRACRQDHDQADHGEDRGGSSSRAGSRRRTCAVASERDRRPSRDGRRAGAEPRRGRATPGTPSSRQVSPGHRRSPPPRRGRRRRTGRPARCSR